MRTTAPLLRFHLVGLPVDGWTFAIRIWIAVTMALLASFWLQLESSFSAALTVGVLAEPTRGRALEKAGYRLVATILGFAASIAIVGLVSQARDLVLAGFAVWLGLCVFAAGLFDGYRSYAAVLSGYTVALIAVRQIDAPQRVFEYGIARGAAIAVGILSLAVVNDLLLAPDRYPQLLAELAAIHRRIRDYAKAAFRREASDPETAAVLMRDLVALRSEVTSLAPESSHGAVRSSAALSATVALVAELYAVRALKALLASSDSGARRQLVSVSGAADLPPATASLGGGETEAGSPAIAPASVAWAKGELLRRDEEALQSLSALESDTRAPRSWRAPLYRPHRVAVQSGLRAAAWFAIASILLVAGGWPAASTSLSWIAIVIGIGATMPDQSGFTTNALIAAPIAVFLSGIFKFVVLNGAFDFPLLAIGLAPFVIGSGLMLSQPDRRLSAVGRLNLLFIPNLLGFSNRETYDPQEFLFGALLLCLGIGVLFAAQRLIPPVSNDDRRRWMLASARSELDLALSRRHQEYEPEEATFRDAVRVGLIADAGGTDPRHRHCLEQALSCFDQAAAFRLCAAGLTRLADGPLAPLAAEARVALVRRDVPRIRAAAGKLRGTADESLAAATRSALILASAVIEAAPP